ncbi:hypothetical protein [Azospirillum argentinense]
MNLNMESPEACGSGWRIVSGIDLDITNHGFQFNLLQGRVSNGRSLIVYRVGDTGQDKNLTGVTGIEKFDPASFALCSGYRTEITKQASDWLRFLHFNFETRRPRRGERRGLRKQRRCAIPASFLTVDKETI